MFMSLFHMINCQSLMGSCPLFSCKGPNGILPMQSPVCSRGDRGDFPPVCHVPEGQGPEPLRVGGGAG